MASYNMGYFMAFIPEQAAALERQGCVVKLFGITGRGIKGYIKELPRLRREIREFRPDVLHAHFGLSCLFANLATRKVPVVSTFHGSDIHLPRLRFLSRIAMRLSAWNIFVSGNTMKQMPESLRKKHCSLVPCGIDLSEEQLMTRDEARKTLGWRAESQEPRVNRYVLFAGRYDDSIKDPELAKQAIEELRAKSEEVKVELIELKGYTRSEVNRLMCAVNCMLLTSKAEASPQVVKEAMACGCPIVSLDVGDVAERTGGVEGCFVVKSREPRDIAEALKKAIAFEGKTNGREKILEYGLTNEQVAQKIIDIYRSICIDSKK